MYTVRSSAVRATYTTFLLPAAATIVHSLCFPRSNGQKNPKLTWFVETCVVIIVLIFLYLFCHMKRPPLRELNIWFLCNISKNPKAKIQFKVRRKIIAMES
jgi:hypothetical protein